MNNVFRSLVFRKKKGHGSSTKKLQDTTAREIIESEDLLERASDGGGKQLRHATSLSNIFPSLSSKKKVASRRHSTMSSTPQAVVKRKSVTNSFAKRKSVTDVTIQQDRGVFLIDDRESHTADLQAFYKFQTKIESIERATEDISYEPKLWTYIEGLLLEHGQAVGYEPQDNPTDLVYKTKQEASAFMDKMTGLDPINPIQPHLVSEGSGLPLDVVLSELLHATKIGLCSMKFAPECERCGGQVCQVASVGVFSQQQTIPCGMCRQPNEVQSLDNISVVFCLHPSILYVLANNFGCYPSEMAMEKTIFIAPVPATTTGSGFCYSVGCEGSSSLIEKPLPKGRYRLHCPIAGVGCYLNVLKDSNGQEQVKVPLTVSDLLFSNKTKSKTIDVPHGRVVFQVTPDTQSLYCLWVQSDITDDELYRLPQGERKPYTSAARVLHHPSVHRYEDFVDAIALTSELEVKHVVFLFTDVVGSTDMYAALGDLKALELIKQHYLILFAAFSRRGRIVKTVGDSVMTAFATGSSAIEAAAEALLEVNNVCQRSDGKPFQIRIGIHSGPAVVVPLNGINDYFGQTVNQAARIESMAAPSGCLVSEETLLDDADAMQTYENVVNIVNDGEEAQAFRLLPKEKLILKGIKKKTKAWGFQLSRPS